MENLKSFEGFLKKWGKPPIPESGDARKKWLDKYDPKPCGDWDAEKAWLDKYTPGWFEKSQREMEEYRKQQSKLIEESNAEYGKYLEGCPFKITHIDETEDQYVTHYEIESDNSRNADEIFYTIDHHEWGDEYCVLLVKRRRKDYEIDEGSWDYEIKRKIKMPDMETSLRWIKRNCMKPLDKKNTDTIKDKDPNRNPGWFHGYDEIYKRKNHLKKVNMNTPDTSTFDNYKYKKFKY
jgi:hypothetical protein